MFFARFVFAPFSGRAANEDRPRRMWALRFLCVIMEVLGRAAIRAGFCAGVVSKLLSGLR